MTSSRFRAAVLAAFSSLAFAGGVRAQTAAPVPVPPAAPATNPAPPTAAPAPPAPSAAAPIQIAPPVPPTPYAPFPTIAPPALDDARDGFGIAQQMARSQKLQARIIWIDGTANLNRVNASDKIAALITQVKSAGFNTIVFDVKPLVGLTLYNSQYAQKISLWKGQTLSPDFDPLAEMTRQAHAAGLSIVANLNAFSEGHRDFMIGPGYLHPEWQTVLYEPLLAIRSISPNAPAYPLCDRANASDHAEDQLGYYTDLQSLGRPGGSLVEVLDSSRRVVAQVDGAETGLLAAIPAGGCAISGTGSGANFLRQNAPLGATMEITVSPGLVPISQRPEEQVPLMTNPNDPDVQARIINMASEIVRNYPVDGIIFDDRLRYAGLNADFSAVTRAQFEKYVGHRVGWPQDIYRYAIDYPSLNRSVVPGPLFETWQLFRALTIRNFVASTVSAIKAIRPNATVSAYVGSWYPQYPELGANWAADDFTAGLRFLTPAYAQTGFAGLLDWMTTGCYYPAPTITDAVSDGLLSGDDVEAAGQFANRAANDRTWMYAGIALDDYAGRPDKLMQALNAAAATTQGVMVFDLSQADPFWPVFTQAFATPATAPNAIPGLLDQLRQQHTAHKASGAVDPPVILYGGTPGAGL